MRILFVDKRLIWPGFFLSFAAPIALGVSGFSWVGFAVLGLGVAAVILSLVKPFPETTSPGLLDRENRWLEPVNAILFAGALAVLGSAALAFYLAPPIQLASGWIFSLPPTLFGAWPWVLLASLAWIPRRSTIKEPLPANQ